MSSHVYAGSGFVAALGLPRSRCQMPTASSRGPPHHHHHHRPANPAALHALRLSWAALSMLQKPVLADEALENKTTLTTVVKGSVAAHAFTPVGNMALVVSHSGHMCLLDPSSNRLAETSHPIRGCTSAVWHPEVGLPRHSTSIDHRCRLQALCRSNYALTR